MPDPEQPTILSADDKCPVCGCVPELPAVPAGTWDGSLGEGSGHWYTTNCSGCGAALVGWLYTLPWSCGQRPEVKVRWEARGSPDVA